VLSGLHYLKIILSFYHRLNYD